MLALIATVNCAIAYRNVFFINKISKNAFNFPNFGSVQEAHRNRKIMNKYISTGDSMSLVDCILHCKKIFIMWTKWKLPKKYCAMKQYLHSLHLHFEFFA